MKYTKTNLKKKTKKQLIDIILKLIHDPFSAKDPLNDKIKCTIADGSKGMTRGE